MKSCYGPTQTIWSPVYNSQAQILIPYTGIVLVESASLEGSRIVLYRESMHKGQVDNVVIDFLRNDTDVTRLLEVVRDFCRIWTEQS